MGITLVWRTDVHISDHNPRSRTDNWADTVLNKLISVGGIAKEVGANAVIDGGDFFDLKSPSRNSHSLVRRVIEVHRDHYHCPVYANVGNHDCVYGDYSYLDQQPLGVLYEAGTFKRLYDCHEAVFVDGSLKVRVVGIPYHGVKYDMGRLESITRGDEDYLVVVAHLLASPTHSTMFDSEDVIRYDVLDRYSGVDCWLFGHWHKDQGIVNTPNGTPVVNIGSLTRGALSQDNLDRIPSVGILTFDPSSGMSVTRKSVPHRPASEVFDLLAKDKEELQQSLIEEFIDHLSQVLIADRQKSLGDIVRETPGISDRVRERVLSYIEKSGGR